ncbi:uncharacterized protein BDZ99DRAFT_544980 [Mytilinidion resinicola]|uniref:Uncharacterized protein n=1 Tax=Mytilinidion resinicola TaxID=574789 RepID=A0A6A6Y6G0_9PEZI|nr:uncharacterized protein BDZ99DRAFT_544980 [Mytilinidion resinicola]KAF2804411.1 hypothetical protein BDZ99DRAFT_544980 [Mytilinidion resinicola]
MRLRLRLRRRLRRRLSTILPLSSCLFPWYLILCTRRPAALFSCRCSRKCSRRCSRRCCCMRCCMRCRRRCYIVDGEEKDVINCDQGRIWREHLELVSKLSERIGGYGAPLRANQKVVKRQGGRGCTRSEKGVYV